MARQSVKNKAVEDTKTTPVVETAQEVVENVTETADINKIVAEMTAKFQEELAKKQEENNTLAQSIQELQRAMLNIQTNTAQPQVANSQPTQNRLVTVINIQPYTMPIVTSLTNFELETFGSTHPVKFEHMNEVISKYLPWLRDGRIILGTQEDYNDLGIGYIYDEVETLAEIEKLVTFNVPNAVQKLVSLDGEFKEICERLIVQAFLDGKANDFNVVRQLDKNGYNIQKRIDVEESDK